MIEIRQTDEYEHWFASLKDRTARVRVDIRVRRLSLGNPGDVEPVGEGVSELKIDYGPGYKIYFVQHGSRYVLLLIGGDKPPSARHSKRQGTGAQVQGVRDDQGDYTSLGSR